MQTEPCTPVLLVRPKFARLPGICELGVFFLLAVWVLAFSSITAVSILLLRLLLVICLLSMNRQRFLLGATEGQSSG